MRAAVLTQLNAPLEVMDAGLTELQYGQVHVRMLAAGICGSQLQDIRGEKGNASYLPHLLGHEGCGVVEAVGIGVTRVRPGDKLVLHWRRAAGIESPFPHFRLGNKTISSGKVTTFSEQTIVSENRVTPIPKDTPRELASLLGCGLSTALGVVENDADIKMGESVLIVGCGGLGANLILAAKMRQATPIYATDVNTGKAALAEAMGATFVSALDLTLGLTQKFQVIINTAGAVSSYEETLPYLADSGRYILVGQPKPGANITINSALHLFGGEGKSIKATQGGGFQPERDVPRYIALHRAGLLKLDGLVTHRVTLENINDGIELVRAGQAGRVLVDFTQ